LVRKPEFREQGKRGGILVGDNYRKREDQGKSLKLEDEKREGSSERDWVQKYVSQTKEKKAGGVRNR